jgi:hypothetical protein
MGGTIPIVSGKVGLGVSYSVAEKLVAPLNASGYGLGIGIQEKLGWIESVPFFGFKGTMNPVAIELTRTNVRQIDVPYQVGLLFHGYSGSLAGCLGPVEQAELYTG